MGGAGVPEETMGVTGGRSATKQTVEPHEYSLHQTHPPQHFEPSEAAGRQLWDEKEEKMLVKLASKHIITTANKRHVDWDAVSKELHAQGHPRSAAAVAAHYRTCHPSSIGGGNSGGGATHTHPAGSRSRWTPEEEHTILSLADKHIVETRGRTHVDWDALSKDLHRKGFERSATAIATHYRLLQQEEAGGK